MKLATNSLIFNKGLRQNARWRPILPNEFRHDFKMSTVDDCESLKYDYCYMLSEIFFGKYQYSCSEGFAAEYFFLIKIR